MGGQVAKAAYCAESGLRRIDMLAFLHSRRVARDLEAGQIASEEVSS